MSNAAIITTPEAERFAEPVARITRDIRKAAEKVSVNEARFLVDTYYVMQEHRKRSDNQVRALTTSNEPHEVIDWMSVQWDVLERGMRSVLDRFSSANPLGVWGKSICGVGPVITAGLLCHIDVTKAHVSHIWNFAGLSPGQKWGKGEKRPWNAALKTLCFKIGECFVKVQGRESDVYGKLFATRKAYEESRNESGSCAEQAAAILTEKNWSKGTESRKALEAGRLPQAQIHARARRWTVKLFLSHWHTVGHFLALGRLPVRPYAFDHAGHADIIWPPNVEQVDGLVEALRQWK